METRINPGQNRLRVTTTQTNASGTPAPKTANGRPSFSKILRKEDSTAGGGGSSPDQGQQAYGRQMSRDPLSHPQRTTSPLKQAPPSAQNVRSDRMSGFISHHSMVSSAPAVGSAAVKSQDLASLGRATAAPSQPVAAAPVAQSTAPSAAIAPLAPAAPSAPAAQGGVHTVKAGDSLWRIARDNNLDWRELARFNQIDNPSLIQIGQQIRLPGGATAAAPAPATPSARTAAALGSVTAAPVASARPAASAPRPTPAAEVPRARVESKFSASPASSGMPFSMAPKAPIASPKPTAPTAPIGSITAQPASAAARPTQIPLTAARSATPKTVPTMAGPFAASPSAAPEMGRLTSSFAPRPAPAPKSATFAPKTAAPAPIAAPVAPRPVAAAAPVAAPAGVASATSVGRTAPTAPVTAPAAAGDDPLKAFGLDEAMVDQIIDRTSQYEGSYTSLNKNTDKAGLSFGFIQFAQKPGSLGQVMTAMAKKNPAKFQKIFGPDAQKMLQIITKSPDHGVDANGRALNPKFDLTRQPWAGRFETAGKDPEFQGVQRQMARKHYFNPMLEVAAANNIKSPEGLSMLFDTSVQQGRNGMQRILRSAMKKRTPNMSEREFLEIVAKTAAKAAGPRWQKNVLHRRMNILNDVEIAKIGRGTASVG